MKTITVSQEGDRVCALFGVDLQAGVAGFGVTEPDALRALADQLEIREATFKTPEAPRTLDEALGAMDEMHRLAAEARQLFQTYFSPDTPRRCKIDGLLRKLAGLPEA